MGKQWQIKYIELKLSGLEFNATVSGICLCLYVVQILTFF